MHLKQICGASLKNPAYQYADSPESKFEQNKRERNVGICKRGNVPKYFSISVVLEQATLNGICNDKVRNY